MKKSSNIVPARDLRQELLKLLAKGDSEIETDEGYDLDTILEEADAFLAEESS